MRINTQRIYELLSKGVFISCDSVQYERKLLFKDISENYSDYESFFSELGLHINQGNQYFYFSRNREGKLTIEQKLLSFSRWIDILDFLKIYEPSFSAGYVFRKATVLERINLDLELRDKACRLYRDVKDNQAAVDRLIEDLLDMSFVELLNEQEGSYKVVSAFHYLEDMIQQIAIYEDSSDEGGEKIDNIQNLQP